MTESLNLTVTGMKCGGCEANVTTKLQALEGVVSVQANHKEDSVSVEFDASKIGQQAIVDAVIEAGYKVG